MADKKIDDIIDGEIARGDDSVVPDTDKVSSKREPTYQMVGDTRIPVSKAHGALWQSRRDQALQLRQSQNIVKAWDEALSYYRNDQTGHRDETDGDNAGNETGKMRMNRRFTETENIVFANTSALVPTLYAKNPSAEFTANDPEDETTGVMLERLVSRLMSKKAKPGINLKPKVRKAVVMTTLTNAAYMEIGYTFKENSSEGALEDIRKLSKELEKAKSPQEVRDIEGRIMALEDAVDVLRPSGPWAKFRRPHDVVVDPDSVDDDHSDARWQMIADYLPTGYLNAKYGKRKGTETVSVYKPTHVLRRKDQGGGGRNTAEQEIDNYSLFADEKKNGAADFGYNDEDSYRKAQRTKVWWVWDRVTQRVLLYSDNDWSWPMWVWDDPYQLQEFFPIYKLQFYTDPEAAMSKGEVTYYLDQQDAINQINSEYAQARQWARRNIFYDKNKISAADVEKYIKGDEDCAIGVDLPEGEKMTDAIQSVVPPSMQFIQLFDKQPLLEAIDRVSSVQPVMRGVEFKTNTTNQAISQYNSVQQTRTDEKIDAVEDFIGQIAWGIAQMCLQFMTIDEVAMLIGVAHAQSWRQMQPDEIARELQMTVVGGSTQKPTSESKKQQALQMGQVLGQFVNAAPIPVMTVLLNTMRSAFNDTIPDEHWQGIIDSMMQQPQPGEEPAPQQGTGEPSSAEAEQGDASSGMESAIAQLEQLIDAMPPQAKEALGAAMAQGVPVREALGRIIQQTQQQPQAA